MLQVPLKDALLFVRGRLAALAWLRMMVWRPLYVLLLLVCLLLVLLPLLVPLLESRYCQRGRPFPAAWMTDTAKS